MAQDSKSLPLPQVPDSLVTPEDRADYVSMHFWDALDFNDTANSLDESMMEQSMVDFLSIMTYASSDTVRSQAVDSLLSRASVCPESFNLVTELAEKYLYETPSPLLNESTYRLFLEAMQSLGLIDEPTRLRHNFVLAQIDRCSPGTQVPPLDVNIAGQAQSLSNLTAQRPAIVLFYDHDCESCQQTLEDMTSDARLLEHLDADHLCVIAVDMSEEVAPRHPEISNWIWANASSDAVDEAYAMRSTPSIYLIGRDGTILLKDTSYSLLSQAIFH